MTMDIVMGFPEWIVVALLISATFSRVCNMKLVKFKSKPDAIGAAIGISAYPFVWIALLYWGGFFA